jgi:NAD-dependent dihydropyrimidine dehydrogenase PreA subunit
MKHARKIIRIDEEKCDGCGICAEACHEGAIRIIDGKARLVSESCCDGLGDCLGPCPQGAITIEEREAEAYDEVAVKRHLAARPEPPACGCPGSAVRDLETSAPGAGSGPLPSRLSHWPVQITLVPPSAPFLEGADLLITADCVPFAYAGLHDDFMAGRAVLVGCPKLDDAARYQEKFTTVFASCDLRSITVLYMEVPCCGGLARLVRAALSDSGTAVPLRLVRIGIRGGILEDVTIPAGSA